MRANATEKIQLPMEFPAPASVPELKDMAQAQKNWWYEARRALQDAIDGLAKSRNRIGPVVTGAGTTPNLASGPISSPVPIWVEFVLDDGRVVVMAAWQKA